MKFINIIALFFCFASIVMVSHQLKEINTLLIKVEKQCWFIHKYVELEQIMKACHQDIIDHPEFYLDMPR